MEAVSLKRIYEYDAARSELVSAEHSLRVALARMGKRGYARSIYFSWPNLESASRKLAGLVSHHYPSKTGDSYLLDDAIKAACEAFEEAPETESFTHRMASYLRTMLESTASQIMYWETHGIMPSGETTAWQVGTSPVLEWVKRKNIERVVFSKRTEDPLPEEIEAAQIVLSSGVLTYNDLVHIARLGCGVGAK